MTLFPVNLQYAPSMVHKAHLGAADAGDVNGEDSDNTVNSAPPAIIMASFSNMTFFILVIHIVVVLLLTKIFNRFRYPNEILLQPTKRIMKD
jgi:hypothetical protein